MKINVIEITSASDVKVKCATGTVIINSEQYIKLGPNEIGFLEGKRRHHQEGIFMQGGIINAMWEGRLTIEFLIVGEIHIRKGDKIAHAIILTTDSNVIYENRPSEHSAEASS